MSLRMNMFLLLTFASRIKLLPGSGRLKHEPTSMLSCQYHEISPSALDPLHQKDPKSLEDESASPKDQKDSSKPRSQATAARQLTPHPRTLGTAHAPNGPASHDTPLTIYRQKSSHPSARCIIALLQG
ncbi:hypothetical protein BJY00DRAFT_179800 [Aspergillus carlsbadensis]|nr:hypothetical protein BJY00DRAFT_179800 [Aspergillus carlsbadensis]